MCNFNCNYCNQCKCYLVKDVEDGLLKFVDTPSVANGTCFKFRIPCNIVQNQVPATPIFAELSINGTLTKVPVWDNIGNVLLTGSALRTRRNYIAVFGNNPEHLLVRNVNNA